MGRFALGLALTGQLALFGPMGARAEQSVDVAAARAVVEDTVLKVLAVLKNGELAREEKRAGIEKIAYGRFDFYTMSRLVLAKYWKRFTPEERREFATEFKTFLAQEYGRRLDDYENQDVAVLGVKPEARGDVTVLTRIVDGKFDDAAVNYRMREKDGEWYVIDVVIEGISLVANWRDQFREVLRGKDGPQKLLAQLRAKNHARAEG